jgi:Ca2+-binding RTX toxin-like protein
MQPGRDYKSGGEMANSGLFAPTNIGQVVSTGVYRIDLSTLGLGTIQSITLWDDQIVSGGTGGASGFDLDFIKLSTTFTASASTAASLTGQNVFDFTTGVSYQPGYFQTWTVGDPLEWNTPYLFGTTGGHIYSPGKATLGVRDGLNLGDSGGLSLGEGGRVTLSFNAPINTAGLYLYIGDAGGGNDDSYVSTSTERLPFLGSGISLTGTQSADTILLGQGLNVHLGAGDDYINGTGGNDTIFAGAGNDNLWGGSGSDALNGGAGWDNARYDYAPAGIDARLYDPSLNKGEAAGDSYLSIEGLFGSGFSDQLSGDGNANWLDGLGGGDYLFGGGGDDHLVSSAWGETLDGGSGWDTVHYDSALFGIQAYLGGAPYQNVGWAFWDTYVSIESLVGSAFNDDLRGDANANALNGQGGNDILYGEGGDDHIWGGVGADYVEGGTGWDSAHYDYATAGVEARLYNASLNKGEAAGDLYWGIEGLFGSGFSDTLYGDGNANGLSGLGADDWLDGVGGGDYLFGGDGNDHLVGRAGGETLDGGSGWDTVRYDYASSGVQAYLGGAPYQNGGWAFWHTYASIESLFGSAFNDDLRGDANANSLNGRDGNDFIVGGGGADYLYGGAGTDYFFFNAPADGGGSGDLIQDFAGVDYLCINGASFGLGSPGGTALETWRFVSGSGANLATTQFGYDGANRHVWYDVDGTGAGGQTVLATLQPGATLTNFDFLVF